MQGEEGRERLVSCSEPHALPLTRASTPQVRARFVPGFGIPEPDAAASVAALRFFPGVRVVVELAVAAALVVA